MTKRRAHGEGSVFQRERDGRWVAQLDLGHISGKRIRKTFVGRSQREVRDRMRQAIREIEVGQPSANARVSLSSFLERWLAEVVEPSLAYKTAAFYRTMVYQHVVPVLGSVALSRLRPVDVQQLLTTKRLAGLGDRSLQAIHATLRRALNIAVRWELIAQNPAALIDAPRPRRNADRVHPIEREAVLRLVAASTTERLGAMIVLLPMIGLRKGELLGLRWSRLDLDGGVAIIDCSAHREKGRGMILGEPKTASSLRTIRLPSQCVEALQRHRRAQIEERLAAGPAWNDLDLVFCNGSGGLLDESAPNHLLWRLCDRVGIQRERIHNLRHTAATVAGEVSGGDLGAIKDLLGHASITITADLYRHILPASQRRLGNAISDYFSVDAQLG